MGGSAFRFFFNTTPQGPTHSRVTTAKVCRAPTLLHPTPPHPREGCPRYKPITVFHSDNDTNIFRIHGGVLNNRTSVRKKLYSCSIFRRRPFAECHGNFAGRHGNFAECHENFADFFCLGFSIHHTDIRGQKSRDSSTTPTRTTEGSLAEIT